MEYLEEMQTSLNRLHQEMAIAESSIDSDQAEQLSEVLCSLGKDMKADLLKMKDTIADDLEDRGVQISQNIFV